MAIQLFNIINGKISLARPEIGLIKEFAAILHRDRGSEGDADGRKKYMAMKEFFYIYLTSDYSSPLINKGYSGKELSKYAIVEAQLPMTWKEDDIIKAAIKKYKELNFDIKGELITELLLLFRGNYKRVTALREAVDKLLEKPDLTRSEAENIAQLQEKIFAIAASTPGKIKSLQIAIKDSESIDMGEKKEMRGGGEVPESADPDRAKS